ncbi:MAG: hypothetical protein P4L84_34460 [Isosphaeraceae bacterium]|nr:hypothetical protein [Isosphaeraceae bacterium]
MTDRIPRIEGGPRSGLETWLARELQSGRFEGLPPYRPLRGGGQRPEQYARRLLAGLKNVELSGWDRELLRDDGRAFRSWAETYPAALPAS